MESYDALVALRRERHKKAYKAWLETLSPEEVKRHREGAKRMETQYEENLRAAKAMRRKP